MSLPLTAGLVLHTDPDVAANRFTTHDGSTLAGDGDPLGRIENLIGDYAHAVQADFESRRPTLEADAQGRMWERYSGGQALTNGASINGLELGNSATDEWTIVVVADWTGSDGTLLSKQSTTSNGMDATTQFGDRIRMLFGGNFSSEYQQSDPILDRPTVYFLRWDGPSGTLTWRAGLYTMFQPSPGTDAAQASSILTWGSRTAGSSRRMYGRYAERAVYDRAISDEEMVELFHHLRRKWFRAGAITLKAPGEVTGLQAWMDPDDPDGTFQDAAGTTPAGPGDPVGNVTDAGADPGLTAWTQATAGARPTFAARHLEMSESSLGAETHEAGSTTLFADAGEAFTVVVVARMRPSHAGRLIAKGSGTGGEFDISVDIARNLGVRIRGSSITNLHMLMEHFAVTVLRWDGSTFSVWQNGIQTPAPTVGTGSDTTDDITLGARSDNFGLANNIDVGAALIYDVAISDADRESLEEWLLEESLAPYEGPVVLTITTESLLSGKVGAPYSAFVEVAGGTEPYTWSVLSGALPSGLSLNTATGEISGTPDTEELGEFTIQVEDADSSTDTQALTLAILSAGYTDFSEHAAGAGLPTGWDEVWRATDEWEVEADAAATGGKWIRRTAGDSSVLRFARWTAQGTLTNGYVLATLIQDADMGLSSEIGWMGVVVRGTGESSAAATGYVIELWRQQGPDGTYARIYRVVDGVRTQVAGPTFANGGGRDWWTPGVPNEVKVVVSGATIEVTVWPSSGSEPVDPQISYTDASPLGTGYVGLTSRSGTTTQWADTFEMDAEAAPPVLNGVVDGTTIIATTSEFESDDPDAEHSATEYQLRESVETDWETLVPGYPVISETFLTEIVLEDNPAFTAVDLRARHYDRGEPGGWSNTVSLETGLAAPVPEKPVITSPVDEVGTDYVIATSSAFDHAEGVGDGTPPEAEEDEEPEEILPYFLAAQWQIQVSGGDWSSPVVDTGVDQLYAAELTQLFDGLSPEVAYQIRTRHQDGKYGTLSEWSDPVTFTTDEIPLVVPDTPTIAVDVCARLGTQLSTSVFSHPEGGATHQSSQWRLCEGATEETASCRTRSSTVELTTFEWPSLETGTYWFYVRHQDDQGRWSEWSEAAGPCEIIALPPLPQFTAPGPGEVIDDDVLIEWVMPSVPDGPWEFEGEFAPEATMVFTELFGRQAAQSHLWGIDALGNGGHYVRVRACYPDDGDCGEWAYLFVMIDRTGVGVSVFYRFSEFASLPATWHKLWDSDDWTSYKLVDENLQESSTPIGLLGRTTGSLEVRQSVLAFTELGEPTVADMTATFTIVQNDGAGYFWRFSQSPFLEGGLGFRASDDPRRGFRNTAHAGSQPWMLPPITHVEEGEGVCGCGFVSETVCRQGPGAHAWQAKADPSTLFRYAVARGRAQMRQQGHKPGTGHWWKNASLPHSGDLARGMNVSNRSGLDEECGWKFPAYTMRFVITRLSGVNRYRLRSRVVGPGLDPTPEWPIDRVLEPTFLSPEGLDDLPCGPCGLALAHADWLVNDPGILWFTFAAVLSEEDILDGPLLGQATLRETD